MNTKKEKITEKITLKAIEIIKNNPEGVRYSELVRKTKQELPGANIHTIQGRIYNLDSRMPETIYKPARGLFRLITFREIEISDKGVGRDEIKIIKKTKNETMLEENFYKPFADWLENEIEECTKAIPLGGNKFKDKWGTPDVIGIYKSRPGDIINLPPEIIAAEIKTDIKDLVTAFGQACAYKLFSNKSYIVIPKYSPQKEIGKLRELCRVFGIGLVLFDSKNPNFPEFKEDVPPIKHEPDRFFTNYYLNLLEDSDKEKLFG